MLRSTRISHLLVAGALLATQGVAMDANMDNVSYPSGENLDGEGDRNMDPTTSGVSAEGVWGSGSGNFSDPSDSGTSGHWDSGESGTGWNPDNLDGSKYCGIGTEWDGHHCIVTYDSVLQECHHGVENGTPTWKCGVQKAQACDNTGPMR